MNSSFKFLDAYEKPDRAVFFGRDAEIEALYKLLTEARLVLVYGPSGTGKTSLIQCGLANHFKPTDWFDVFVRRKENINVSLDREIANRAATPIEPGATIVEAVNSLFLDHFRPVYLIFDQFEELFIFGTPEEQSTFITSIKTLLDSQVDCKIIISMREEYIAMLHDFEKIVPTLFAKRLRIEPMSMTGILQVITGTTAALGIGLENGPATAQRIIDKLSNKRSVVQLAYLQVYLDRLYRSAGGAEAAPIVFTDALIERVGGLGDVMAEFLDEQTDRIQQQIAGRHPGTEPQAVRHILEQLATLEGTKRPMGRAEIGQRLAGLGPAVIDDALHALEAGRLLRLSDDVYELSHDTLAGHIAATRDNDLKMLLRLQKIVRDGFEKSQQTKAMLVEEDLVELRPKLGRLGLSDAEAGFVAASEKKLRRARWKRRATVAGVIAVLSVTTLFSVGALLNAQDTIDTATRGTSRLTTEVYLALEGVPGTLEVRRQLIDSALDLNTDLTGDTGDGTENDSNYFWDRILEGDGAMASDPAKAAEFYEDAVALADSKRAENADAGLGITVAGADEISWGGNLSIALGKLADAQPPEEARKTALRVLALDKAMAKAEPKNSVWVNNLFISITSLGDVAFGAEKYDQAWVQYLEAHKQAQKLVALEPNEQSARQLLAYSHMNLGSTAYHLDEPAKAREHLKSAGEILLPMVKADLKERPGRETLSNVFYYLALIEADAGKYDIAKRHLLSAIDLNKEMIGFEPDEKRHREFEGLMHNLMTSLSERRR